MLEAGPALDALVGDALDLAKWFVCPNCASNWYGTQNITAPPERWVRFCKDEYGRGCSWRGPDSECFVYPPISTDVAVALAALSNRDLYIALEGRGNQWLCSSHNAYERTHRDSIDVTAPTPALAIARFLVARAALKATTAP